MSQRGVVVNMKFLTQNQGKFTKIKHIKNTGFSLLLKRVPIVKGKCNVCSWLESAITEQSNVKCSKSKRNCIQ